jgi:hypothetical protein
VNEEVTAALLKSYQDQVLRWNRQINLITRKDTAARLPGLLHQCRACLDAARDSGEPALANPGNLVYFDLGSGAGLPGVVWHTMLSEGGHAPRTCLVEPREKRAWFLNRLNSLAGMPPYRVFRGRWGRADAAKGLWGEPGALLGPVLISLKALHLSDPEVLEGLAAALAGGGDPRAAGSPLLVARFYPWDQTWSQDLASRLEIPDPGAKVRCGNIELEATTARVLSPGAAPGASLVLSSYLVSAPA